MPELLSAHEHLKYLKSLKTGYKRIPLYGWTGFLITLSSWYLNWELEGLRTHWGFFLLWLGYILSADGIVFAKKQSSLLTRDPAAFILLFVISAPFWWLFEIIDYRTRYWIYLGKEQFTHLEYYAWCTLAFSTVIPAVLETTELLSLLKWFRRPLKGPRLGFQKGLLPFFLFLGIIMLLLLLARPDLFPYFFWISLYFIIEPVNVRLGNRNLLSFTGKGNWQPVICLWTATLICGFFWEMWNYYSYPKWKYNVPHYNFWHVFEMPLPGYLGYLPFGLELYAFYNLVTGLPGIKRTRVPGLDD
jgi:hypothetical protein